MATSSPHLPVNDVARLRTVFRDDVLRGLRASPRELPCKYFYDDAGSALFERITQLPEYYLTRTELEIMRRHAGAMATALGPRCLLIEYGSGSSTKTRLLLNQLREPAGYVPIDVSAGFLRRAAQALANDYPALSVLPVAADFCDLLELPVPRKVVARRIVYFPGSTIGNFTPGEAVGLMRRTAALCGPGGGLLLGADLKKDASVIEAAYNDAQGLTAAFNRNLLVRINRELGGDFVPRQFAHRAFFDEVAARIEMHLVSTRAQQARVHEVEFSLAADESIRTEYSYKYELDALHDLARTAGFCSERTWTDERQYFSVSLFSVPDGG